jgi:hypothetical protein
LFINILLLVFSILRKEIVLEVLLSLANGALILYQVSCPVLREDVLTGVLNVQCMCASLFPLGMEFYNKHKNLAIFHIFVVIEVSILSPVLPHVLKEADKAFHLAGLIFFAVEYSMLCWFYGHGCRKLYWKPTHQSQGENATLVQDLLWSNIGLSIIAIISAVPSAYFYG